MPNVRVLILGTCGLFLGLLLALLLAECVWGNGRDNLEAYLYTKSALSEKYGPLDTCEYRLVNVTSDKNSGARLYTIEFKYNQHTGIIRLLCRRHIFTTLRIQENSG
jgi:hypothetical protein